MLLASASLLCGVIGGNPLKGRWVMKDEGCFPQAEAGNDAVPALPRAGSLHSSQ